MTPEQSPLSDAHIVDVWRKNAAPWTAAVREDRIESRVLVTNEAIVNAVLSRSPTSVLDIGCGEGWLARRLAAHGIQVIGFDVVPELIEQAQRSGGGHFHLATYEAVAARQLDIPRVDVAVANFSLLGKESVDGLIRRMPALLEPRGVLIIQTLHPLVASGDEPYIDGWRPGSWGSCALPNWSGDPAPWHFRTTESWVRLITDSGLHIVELREPLHPTLQKPASIIFIAEAPG